MPLTQVFVSISDPRSARHSRHDLAEVLTVAVCAVLSGVDDFLDIELWREAEIDWLRGFMKIEHGIPSHDTIGRVFGMMAPEEFQSAFSRWVGIVVPKLTEDAVVAIDGKTSRRAGSKGKTAASPLHLVSAFAVGMRVVLGQTATAEKSNEIIAIPELLAKLALEGCVVTIDAMGTQTKIARTIRERGAHYLLCVKDNHPKLLDSIMFADIDLSDPMTPTSTHEGASPPATAAPRSAAAAPLMPSIGFTRAMTGRTSPASPTLSVCARSVIAPVPNAPTTSAACPPTPSGSPAQYAVIGRWRIAFTGVWTCSSTRISHVFVAAMPPTIWPSSATS